MELRLKDDVVLLYTCIMSLLSLKLFLVYASFDMAFKLKDDAILPLIFYLTVRYGRCLPFDVIKRNA